MEGAHLEGVSVFEDLPLSGIFSGKKSPRKKHVLAKTAKTANTGKGLQSLLAKNQSLQLVVTSFCRFLAGSDCNNR